MRNESKTPNSYKGCSGTNSTNQVGRLRDSAKLVVLLPVRITEICFVVLAYALKMSFSWSLSRFSSRNAYFASQGNTLREGLQALGPTFIKLGQILSSRPDLVSPEISSQLAGLQEQVESRKPAQVRRLIAQFLGRELNSVFRHFEEEPIAAGSVAHVYRAELLDGSVVAVKIVRPGVRWRMICDMVLFSATAKILSLLPRMRLMPMAPMVEEVRHILICQLDLSAEACNYKKFSENFCKSSHVQLPLIHSEFSNDRMLTMEYLDGLQRVEQMAKKAGCTGELANTCLRALFQMIFVDGFVHGDLHPGNVRFKNDEELVLLDCGLVVHLDPKKRSEFTRFFLSIATNNGSECAKIALSTSTWRTKIFDWSCFEKEMCELVNANSGKSAEQFEVAHFAKELFELFRRNGLRGSTDFVTVILALVVFEGIVKQISPSLDFQTEARSFLLEVGF
ncbi:ABC1 kinase family protein [Serratia fonticola]|uniref:ABC1 kinase family protein n=1 Tax=Serratia fonticola TaxID=47917 RepID=UPI002176FAB2|nr:AarF/UbiB family protein [Serratia fonticola]CAI0850191.1 Aminoglycoside acetyltransferase regulator [Serratia fonticola]CAI0937309.1 Aminoglycoside acetyltransferase regulator [Serratia fonticola]CAI1685020.1 Aminoglycoside acetyltransferase regulator [Serratia fonticola]CAI1855600.1 Aminoglycoside acetyltransferase regulator [Serratia fonticola]